jgi:hypothetical protein
MPDSAPFERASGPDACALAEAVQFVIERLTLEAQPEPEASPKAVTRPYLPFATTPYCVGTVAALSLQARMDRVIDITRLALPTPSCDGSYRPRREPWPDRGTHPRSGAERKA